MSALPRIPFNKPPLSLADQLSLLISRGLTMSDPSDATHYLTHIGYYRLSGYALPFQIGGSGADRHNFKPGVTFDDILDRYVFDRKLRLLVMDAIERIEISVRAALSNILAPRHGAHWYMSPAAVQSDLRSRALPRRHQATDRPRAREQDTARHLHRALLSDLQHARYAAVMDDFRNPSISAPSRLPISISCLRNLPPCAGAMACRIRSSFPGCIV